MTQLRNTKKLIYNILYNSVTTYHTAHFQHTVQLIYNIPCNSYTTHHATFRIAHLQPGVHDVGAVLTILFQKLLGILTRLPFSRNEAILDQQPHLIRGTVTVSEG